VKEKVMRATHIAVVLPVLIVFPGVAAADDTKPAEASIEARVAWLKSRVVPLRSIDPADEDFADLEPIRQAIGDARIVQLSEQSHGDGATFHARTRLIKFLHQKCGFDVLAFESGLYDCRKAWDLLRAGQMPARQAISQGVFGIWTGALEVQPLIEYLGHQARKPRPLEVCGFDCQFSGSASTGFLPTELTALLNKLPPGLLAPEQRAAAVGGCRQLATAGLGAGQEEQQALAACHKALADAKPSETLPASELAFWRQVVESLTVLAEVEAARKAGVKTERNHINLRDAQMAKNLVWLAREAYPQRKIIVWAAAFHLLRNQQTVAMVVEPGKTPAERKTVFPYPQIKTMANEAWKELEKETYSIFFTAAEGDFQTIRMPKSQKLAPLIPGSLEDLLVKAGTDIGFLDLRRRGADGKWLDERLVSRVLGNVDHEGEWTKVFDGLIFTRRMYGATPDVFAGKYQPKPDAAALGVPFDRYTTRDALDRTITFYLSHLPKGSSDPLPVALFIQGSGSASVFSERDGKVYGGLQNLLLAAGQGQVRVLVVEKPGVAFGTISKRPGSAEESPVEFRREHTLPRWVEAVNAALQATQRLGDVDWKRTLVVGHSEGGIVAAHLAAANRLVTHVAVLSSSGPTQLFDLIELAGQARPADRSPTDARARAEEIHDGWAKVLADPDSEDRLWLGHPHRRWSSFLKTSTLEGLSASRAAIFAAHGTADKAVPVTSFDVLRAELTARGHDLVALRLEDCDHGFRKSDNPPNSTRGFQEVFGRAIAWFQDKHTPTEQAIKKDIDRFQGTWQVVSLNQEGENRPLAGPFANLQAVVKGENRILRAGETILAQSRYRIDPLAQPPAIDVVLSDGAMRGQTMLGIYEINGDRLRLCLGPAGGERPCEFAPKAGSGHVLQELKRASGSQQVNEPPNS
jgi:erythromycin esterase